LTVPNKVSDIVEPDLAAMDVEIGTDSSELKKGEELSV
jgi:hypothetical protein